MPHYRFDDDGNLIQPAEPDPYDADTEITAMEPEATSTPKKKVRKRTREPEEWQKSKLSKAYNTGARRNFCGKITARSVQGEHFNFKFVSLAYLQSI